MKNAMADFKKRTGKNFGHIEAWDIVRKYDKWSEQPIVGQTSSSTSEKQRKSSQSSNENVETIIPDLNDDTTPRKKGGKKTITESSTSSSVATSFENYAAKKAQVLEATLEKKRVKDEK